ncbi:MAG: hypothetical protein OXG78_14355 [Chloroflexi bacterium]|nr:hypothetical protein [Chloroflexota bacterium]
MSLKIELIDLTVRDLDASYHKDDEGGKATDKTAKSSAQNAIERNHRNDARDNFPLPAPGFPPSLWGCPP